MLAEVTDNEILTWEEIRNKYPRQWVCMEVIEWKNTANVKRAIVRYTSTERPSICELDELRPGLIRQHTHPNEGLEMGCLTC